MTPDEHRAVLSQLTQLQVRLAALRHPVSFVVLDNDVASVSLRGRLT